MNRDPLLPPAPRSKAFGYWPFPEENHNVIFTMLCTCTTSVADNVWSGTVLASYLLILMDGKNTYVGIVEAAQGLSSLIFAIPIGYLADKYSKAKAIWLGGALIPIAVGVTAFAVIYGVDHESHNVLCANLMMAAMCVWGVVQSISGGPAQALFADSIREGDRSRYYNRLFITYLLSSVVGPLVTVVLFYTHGNKYMPIPRPMCTCTQVSGPHTTSDAQHARTRGRWELADLRNITLVGLGFELLAAPIFFAFRDSCALEGGGNAAAAPAAAAPAAAAVTASDPTAADPSEARHSQTNGADSAVADGATASAGGGEGSSHLGSHLGCKVRCRWLIPYLLFASSMLFSLGSGMTVKFFPLCLH